MLDPQHVERQPGSGDSLVDEGGATCYWRADAWSFDDIEDEFHWLFEHSAPAECLGEIWFRPRWVTSEERADPDRLYDLFGCDADERDTTVYYEHAKPGSLGAVRYWTTEVSPSADA